MRKLIYGHPLSPAISLLGGLFLLLFVFVATSVRAQVLEPEVFSASRVNTSQPLRDMPVVPGIPRGYPQVVPNRLHDFGPGNEEVFFDDPVTDLGAPNLPGGPTGTVDLSFEAMTADKSAAVAGRFAPPDTNGDIGPNHYVQWINVAAEIYDRNGNSVLGPFPGNAFFAGLGGLCETTNHGDPIVLYDHLADRWMVAQFVVGTNPAFLCVAISATADPTGSYHQYAFSFGATFPDYPKYGVWPDAYYATTRSFNTAGTVRLGTQAVAFERAQMLAGLPAQMVVFSIPLGTNIDGWLPADLDGPAPPAGTPGIFGGRYAIAVQQIRLYELDVNWASPGSSTLTSLATLTEAPYSYSTADVTQPAPGETLDRHARFTMFRLQYRNFGTHQTLVTNHTVQAGAVAAPRWYELRDSGGGWGIHQQGTFAPGDGHHRWMGSAAMNGAGEIALGYSVSSTTLMPTIRFTGQTTAMSGTGIMDVPETLIHAGTGVQVSTSTRWGDYSMMAVDPVSDDQFWYTQEYYANTGSFDWKSRVAAVSIDNDIPVELVSLTATASGSDLNLNWLTSSETNNAGFEVQLRETGDYQAMGFVEGHGTTTVEQSYNYTISDLGPGTYTARLKQIDFDGAFEYTHEIEIAVGVPGTHVLTQAYPNPFNPLASFSLSVAAAQHVEVALYNAIGQQVESLFSGPMEAGQTRDLTINGANLPSGSYYYRVIGQTFAESGRVTLLR